LANSFGGDPFFVVFGGDTEAPLDRDSVDDLLDAEAFWNVLRNEEPSSGFDLLASNLAGFFFLGSSGLDPRPLSRDELSSPQLLPLE
jgi:hypothetical protein